MGPTKENAVLTTDSTIIKKPFKHVFNKRVILKGCLWLGLLTIASIAVVFFYSHTGETIKAMAGIKIRFIFICLAMAGADLMMGSWRNHIFIRKLSPGLSHWVSFQANVANMFMGAVTPFHSGAGPAQLYVYNRHGVKILDGFVVSLINMGATLLFMPLAGLFALLAMKNQLDAGVVPVLLRYGFSIFSVFLLFFLLAFWKPASVGKILIWLASGFAALNPSKKEMLLNRAINANDRIIKYQEICSKLLREFPFLFPTSLLITTLLYLNKYGMQYVILLGLGIHASLLQVISIQILIQFMIYFAPSPGGSGFAEAGIAVLFARIVPSAILPIFTLLQRSFLLFIPAIIGACVILRLLRTHAAETDIPVEEMRKTSGKAA